jgi:hypothetical protein
MINYIRIITFAILLFSSYIHSFALTNYTVGGTTNTSITPKNYSTILAAYNACTTTDSYIIEVKSNYTGETYPINLNTSNASSIIIRPQTGVTNFTFNSTSQSIFIFNGSSKVTIDGRPGGTGNSVWTLQNTSTTSTANTIQFINSASTNHLQYCTVYGSSTGSSAASGVILFGGTTASYGNSANYVEYCTVGKDNVTNMPYQVFSSNDATGKANQNNHINNNNIINFSGKGIYMDSLKTDMVFWEITGNSFYQTQAYTIGGPIVMMDLGGLNLMGVTGNFLGGQAPQCGGGAFTIPSSATSSFMGILIRSTITQWPGVTCSVGNNTIANIALTTTATTGIPFIGIESRATLEVDITNSTIGKKCSVTNNALSGNVGFVAVRNVGIGKLNISGTIGGFKQFGSNTGASSINVHCLKGTIDLGWATIGGDTINSNTSLTHIHCAATGTINYYATIGAGTLFNSTGNFSCINNLSINGVSFNGNIRDISLPINTGTVELIGINNQAGPLYVNSSNFYNISSANSAPITLINNASSGVLEVNYSNFYSISASNNAPITIIKHAGTSASVIANNFYQISQVNTGTLSTLKIINTNTSSATTFNSNIIGNTTIGNIALLGNTSHNLVSTSGSGGLTANNNFFRNISIGNGGSLTTYSFINASSGTFTCNENTIQDILVNASSVADFGSIISSASSNTINANTISNIQFSNTGNVASANQAILVTGTSGTLSKNFISGLGNASSSLSAKIIGMDINAGSWNLYNNVILLNNNGAANGLTCFGIWARNTSGTNTIYHNSIKVYGSQTGNAATYSFYRSGAATNTVKNNLFQNIRTGGTLGHYAESTISGGYTSDYNYLENANANQLASFAGVDKNLAAWKISSLANNSTTGTTTLDASGRQSSSFTFTGSNLTAIVPYDYNGAIRPTAPALGAYQVITNLSITNFSPLSGTTGSTLTITGTGFSIIPSNNIVRMGGIKATVSTATATQLTVIVPAGATYNTISVVTGGQIAQTLKAFLVTNTSNCIYFDMPTIITGTFYNSGITGDFNDDGNTDLLLRQSDGSINLLNGVGNGTFASAVSFSGYTGSNSQLSANDFNRDGLLDYLELDGIGNVRLNGGSGTFPTNQPLVGNGSKNGMADLNKDGILDLISVNGNSLIWAYGTGTQFGPPSSIPASNSNYIQMADVNNDGYPDAIISNTNKTISICLGSSSGIFTTKTDYSTGNLRSNSIEIGDFNKDNYIDIVVASNYDKGFSVLLNSGTGTFPTQLPTTTTSAILYLAVGDINGDGNLDIVTSNFDEYTISTYLGLGTGMFNPKQDFYTGYRTQELILGDYNKDGKHDIVSISYKSVFILMSTCSTPPPTITSFTPANGLAGTAVTITGTFFDPNIANNSVSFGNVKAVVTASSSTQITAIVPVGCTLDNITIETGGKYVKSSSKFNVSATPVTCITTTTFAPKVDFSAQLGITDLTMADLNGDGKKDLISVNNGSNSISIYINTSTSTTISYATPINITTGANTTAVDAGDLDSDGWVDIVVGYGNRLTIYKNLGSLTGSFATGVDFITTTYVSPQIYDCKIGDMDSDGKPDIVVTYYNGGSKLGVLNNQCIPGSITSSSFIFYPNLYNVSSGKIMLTNISGDARLDIILITNNVILTNRIPPGGLSSTLSNNYFIEQTNTPSISAKGSPLVIDIDGDGLLDIATATTNGFTVLRNTTTGTNTQFASTTYAANYSYNISAGDIDGDGKPDIIAVGQTTSSASLIAVFKNNSTPGTIAFGSMVNIAPAGTNQKLTTIDIGDINLDGKPDLVVGGLSNTTSISTFQNRQLPTASISGTTTICNGSTTDLTFNFTGDGPWTVTYSENGTNAIPINVSTNPYLLSINPKTTTVYKLVSTIGASTCVGTVSTNSVTVTVTPLPSVPTVTTPTLTRCGIGEVKFKVPVLNGIAKLYSLSSGGTSLSETSTNDSLITPTIASTTNYFVEAFVNNCPSASRTPVTAIVNAQPSILSTIPGNRCDPGSLDVTVIPDIGTTTWYSTPTGGATLTPTGSNTYTTPSLTNSTTYYVSVDYNGCKTPANGTRIAVQANINITPTLTTTSTSRCDAGTIFLSAAITPVTAGIINWYDSPTTSTLTAIGTTFGIQNLTATKTYYVQANNNGCLSSATRVPVTATIINTPTLITPTHAARCDSGTVALSATTNGSILKWYDASAGGNLVNTGLTYTTPKLIANTTYYLETSNSGCVMPSRTAINAAVTIPSINEATLNPGRLNNAYTVTQLTATNLISPTWSITGALPVGMTFTAAGKLQGTPTVIGSFLIKLSATSSGCTASRNYNFEVTPNTSIWNGSSWSNGVPDATTDAVIAGNYTSGTNEVLNARSMIVDVGALFMINGTTTINIGNTLTNNGQISQKCSSTLTAATKTGNAIQVITPSILPSTLASGKQGTQYVQTLAFAAANPTFSISSGSLPSGLVLNGNVIEGIPTASGTSTIRIKAVSGSCIYETTDIILAIKDLINPELAFTDRVIIKRWEDGLFTLPVTSKNTSTVINYSIVTPNACAEILPITNQIKINCASPISDIWIKITQAATTDYEAAVDSVRLIIIKAQTTLAIHSTAGFVALQNSTITFDTTNYDAPVSFGPSTNATVATVLPDGTIQPKSAGTFSFKITLAPTALYSGLDTTFTFTVYPAPIAPIAIADTIFLVRDLDFILHPGSVNLLTNDIGVTGTLKINLTDIDLVNTGQQNIYYSPPIGAFQLDTLTGILSITPFKALKGINKIGYTVTDANGLTSPINFVYIVVLETQEIPDLKANGVMTANGDGSNDALIIGFTDINAANSIVISDQASNIVFQTDNYLNDWEGLDASGNPLEAGIYYYVFTEKVGSKRTLRGFVTIVR